MVRSDLKFSFVWGVTECAILSGSVVKYTDLTWFSVLCLLTSC